MIVEIKREIKTLLKIECSRLYSFNIIIHTGKKKLNSVILADKIPKIALAKDNWNRFVGWGMGGLGFIIIHSVESKIYVNLDGLKYF